MSTGLAVTMSINEAEECIEGIKEALKASAFHFEKGQQFYDTSRKLLWQLHEYEGWRVLGFTSWLECVEAHFKGKKATLYKRLAAAAIEQQVSPLTPIGSIHERVLRPLAKKKFTEDTRKTLFEIASNIAGAPASVTSGLMESVVEVLGDALATGTLQDTDGKQFPLFQRVKEDVLARTVERNERHKQHLQGNRGGVKIASAVEIKAFVVGNSISFNCPKLSLEQIKLIRDEKLILKVTIWGDKREE